MMSSSTRSGFSICARVSASWPLRGGDHLVALLAQHQLQEVEDVLLVVDDQDLLLHPPVPVTRRAGVSPDRHLAAHLRRHLVRIDRGAHAPPCPQGQGPAQRPSRRRLRTAGGRARAGSARSRAISSSTSRPLISARPISSTTTSGVPLPSTSSACAPVAGQRACGSPRGAASRAGPRRPRPPLPPPAPWGRAREERAPPAAPRPPPPRPPPAWSGAPPRPGSASAPGRSPRTPPPPAGGGWRDRPSACASRSRPLRSGSSRSSTTTSGWRSAARVAPSAALPAASTDAALLFHVPAHRAQELLVVVHHHGQPFLVRARVAPRGRRPRASPAGAA